MRPTSLEGWTIDAVLELLRTGSFETEYFDYKEKLPDRRDNKAKERLRKTCCAFANSDGGFIVFGILDDRSKPATQRLTGIDDSIDLPEHFGSYPRDCSPSVGWTFLNPPLKLENGNDVHVIEIPKSWQAPHATGDRDKGWSYVKRTNKGNEGMSVEEIRMAFLGFYEKRLKLQLLRSELTAIARLAQGAYYEEDEISTMYSLVTFDTHVVESVLADTYSITADHTDFLASLNGLRQLVNVANNRVRLLFSIINFPMTNKAALVRQHNVDMKDNCEGIQTHREHAVRQLDQLLDIGASPNPNTREGEKNEQAT